MDVIQPVNFEPATAFAGTDLALTAANYSNVTTYALGDKATYFYRLYQSLQAGNVGNLPPFNPDFTIDPPPTAFWAFIGPDNQFAMFDNKGNTSSTRTTSFYQRWVYGNVPGTLNPVSVTTIAVLNVNAVTVQLILRDNSTTGTIFYNQTKGINDVLVGDWYDYFFLPVFSKISQIIFDDLPATPTPLTNANYAEIIVTGITGSTVSVGSVICGNKYFLGLTQYGATAGISDYSKKETDVYGNIKITKRAFSKKLNAKLEIANGDGNRVQALMYSLRATPCVWIGSDDARFQESLIIYGFYQDFSTEIAYPNHSLMNLEIQGLT